MSHLTLLAGVLALALSASPSAPPTGADGRIESEGAHTEILGRPVRAGDRIELPEGFLQVEEDGTEEGEVGSFTVVPAESLYLVDVSPQPLGGATDPAAAAPGAVPPCYEERNAYLLELWKQSGIEDVRDPIALLEGLQAGASGPRQGFYWFAIQTDAFRHLAWSSELRDRAEALVRCIRGG